MLKIFTNTQKHTHKHTHTRKPKKGTKGKPNVCYNKLAYKHVQI